MKRITVLIDGQSTTITLNDSIVVCGERSLYTRSATVYWAYNNISETSNNVYRLRITSYRLQPGFWTFEMIKSNLELIKGINVSIDSYNNKCTINSTSTKTLSFINSNSRILEILGFTTKYSWDYFETEKSNKPVDPLLGLKYLKIHCDIVDNTLNINEKGKCDSIITTIPVSVQQSLYGSVQNLENLDSKVNINQGVINELKFYVTGQDDNPINVGKILLDCYIV